MSVTSIDLLRFILNLLGDPSKAEEFASDPSGSLAVAGLNNVTCADVDAITPLIANSAPGAVSLTNVATGNPTAGEMIQNLVNNVAVSNFDNSGVIQNIWGADEVKQAFASGDGTALSGDLASDDPIIVGDGNLVASDTAQATGRDSIQNQGDGNMTLGGDQTVAQDSGVIAGGDNLAQGDKAGGDNIAQGDKVGGNNNEAENTGNLTQHDQSLSVGGNYNQAENTGNVTNHDESVDVGGVNIDNSVGGDYWETGANLGGVGNTETTNTTTNVDNSIGGDNWAPGSNVGGIGNTEIRDSGNTEVRDSGNTTTIVAVEDNSVGGDLWEANSNTGGIGNTTNTTEVRDSGNTTTIVAVEDNSVGGDLWEANSNTGGIGNTEVTNTNLDNSVGGDYWGENSNTGGIGNTVVTIDDNSTTSGDANTNTWHDESTTSGDANTFTWHDESTTSGDTWHDESTTSGDANTFTWHDESTTSGDANAYTYHDESTSTVTVDDNSTSTVTVDDNSTSTVDNNSQFTYDDHSVGGDYYQAGGGSSYGDYHEGGSGNTDINVDVDVTDESDYTWGA